jgi:hypothetical protein
MSLDQQRMSCFHRSTKLVPLFFRIITTHHSPWYHTNCLEPEWTCYQLPPSRPQQSISLALAGKVVSCIVHWWRPYHVWHHSVISPLGFAPIGYSLKNTIQIHTHQIQMFFIFDTNNPKYWMSLKSSDPSKDTRSFPMIRCKNSICRWSRWPPPLGEDKKKYIQALTGTLLHYSRRSQQQ